MIGSDEGSKMLQMNLFSVGRFDGLRWITYRAALELGKRIVNHRGSLNLL